MSNLNSSIQERLSDSMRPMTSSEESVLQAVPQRTAAFGIFHGTRITQVLGSHLATSAQYMRTHLNASSYRIASWVESAADHVSSMNVEGVEQKHAVSQEGHPLNESEQEGYVLLSHFTTDDIPEQTATNGTFEKHLEAEHQRCLEEDHLLERELDHQEGKAEQELIVESLRQFEAHLNAAEAEVQQVTKEIPR